MIYLELTIIGILLMAFTINATTIGNPASTSEEDIKIRVCPGSQVECFTFLFIKLQALITLLWNRRK